MGSISQAGALQVAIEIDSSKVPVLPGVADLCARGVRSSAWASNARALDRVTDAAAARKLPLVTALVDPQTSGAGPSSVSPDCSRTSAAAPLPCLLQVHRKTVAGILQVVC